MLRWVRVISELLKPAIYYDTEGNRVELPRAAGLAQIFHHGGHHRGQLSAALSQIHFRHLQAGQKPSLYANFTYDMQRMGSDFMEYRV